MSKRSKKKGQKIKVQEDKINTIFIEKYNLLAKEYGRHFKAFLITSGDGIFPQLGIVKDKEGESTLATQDGKGKER